MTHPPRRLVLDTNVVLDLIFWRDPSVARLAAALQEGRVIALGDDACLGELNEVLSRPQFGGGERDVTALFTDFAHRCQSAAPDQARPGAPLPRCRDPDDQKFLELARRGGADWLVSRDKALLALARKKYGIADFRIMTPQQADLLLAADER